MILLLIFLLIIFLLPIYLLLTQSSTTLLPVNFNTFTRSSGQSGNFYTVYFKLKDIDIDQLERETTSPLTVETIRGFVDTEEKAKAIQWLNENGTFYEWQGTGTMGGWEPSQEFLKEIELYSALGYQECTLNNYYQFPFGITVNLFNQVADTKAELKPLSEWVEEKKMYGYNANPTGGTAYNSPTTSSEDRSIFILQYSPAISVNSIEVFTEYYNNKYSTSYTVQHFLDRLITFILDRNLQIIPIPLSGGTYEEDLANSGEAIVDIFTAFEINPNFTVYTSCGIFDNGNFIYDTNPIIQSSLINAVECNVFSSSIVLASKIDIRDYSRISIESRLYSLMGMTQFNSSGDQGPWNRGNIDINRPDISIGAFNGDAIISVGGYTYVEDNLLTMNEFQNQGLNTKSTPGASAGGMMRYYPNPEWKKNYSASYRNKNSVCDYLLRDGTVSTNTECQINKSGAIYPDIVGNSVRLLPNTSAIVFGTSVSAPTVAANFANLGKKVVCFHRMLYSPKFSFTVKNIQGRNTFGPLLGYSGDEESDWDPVSGRGVVDFEKLNSYL